MLLMVTPFTLFTTIILAIGGASAGPGPCPSYFGHDPTNSIPSDLKPALDKLTASIGAAIKKSEGTQGMSVAIVYDQTTIYTHSWGTEDGTTPVTEDSKFLVASVTKLITALTLLAHRNDVDLDAPLSNYVTGCPPCDKMSFRQLLTHTAGFPTDPACGILTQNCKTTTAEQIEAAVAAGIPLYPPGANIQYSNFGYSLIGQLLAEHLGVGYEALVNSTVLGPLGMGDSSFDPSQIDAQAYFPNGAAIDSGDWGWANPAGGMVTSASDLAKIVKLLLRFDDAEPGLGLDSQTLWQMFTTQTDANGPAELDFSLGMEVDFRPEGVVASKIGSQGFFFPTAPAFLALGWPVEVLPNT